MDHLYQFASKFVHYFQNIMLTVLATDRQTNERTSGQTDNAVPPASLAPGGGVKISKYVRELYVRMLCDM